MKQYGSSIKKTVIVLVFACLAITLMGQTSYETLETALEEPEKVLELRLVNQGLAEFPPEIVRLVNLEDLSLKENQLTELPVEIGRLVNLIQLDLTENHLTALPAEIGQLTNIKELWLHENQLTELPVEIGRLANLQLLAVNGNHLTALPAEFGQLTNLRELYIMDNDLTGLPAAIGKLEQLRILNAQENTIGEVPPSIGQLNKLEYLFLADNLLEQLPRSIGNLTSLRSLDLSNNHLSEMPSEIGKLTSLRYLDLSNNQLEELPPDIAELTSLRELNLTNNRLPELPPVERAAKLADFVDSLEAGNVPTEPPPVAEDFENALESLSIYLEANPEDVQALILFARLGHVVNVSRLVVIPGGGEIPSSEGEYAPLHAALDRALTLELDNAEAHYWHARLYGIREPVVVDDVLWKRPRNLDKVIEHAQRAVELAPARSDYREALGLYLYAADRYHDAVTVTRELTDGRHLMHRLLTDMEALELPESATYCPTETQKFISLQESRGRYVDIGYAALRARVYIMPGTTSELERFLARRWPDVSLFRMNREKAEGMTISQYAQFFEWREDGLNPTAKKNQMPKDETSGLALSVFEIKNPTQEALENFDLKPVDAFCQIYLMNFRLPAGED